MRLQEIVKYQPWLFWWLRFMLIILGFAGLYILGVIELAWNNDVTKISFLIPLIFFAYSIRTGRDIYVFCRINNDSFSSENYLYFCRRVEEGWYRSEQFLSLGMLGTLIGFIIAISGFELMNSQQLVASLPSVIQRVAIGLGSALYTTASGLICCLLLREQLFFFRARLEKQAESRGFKTGEIE